MGTEEEKAAACAARDEARDRLWAVWAAIGGEAADNAVRMAQNAPQLDSGFVTEGTHGLPRWKAEQIKKERRAAKERAQARFNAALAARDALRAHPEYKAAQAAFAAAEAAVILAHRQEGRVSSPPYIPWGWDEQDGRD